MSLGVFGRPNKPNEGVAAAGIGWYIREGFGDP